MALIKCGYTSYGTRHPGAGGVLIEHRDDGPAWRRRLHDSRPTKAPPLSSGGNVVRRRRDSIGVVAAEVRRRSGSALRSSRDHHASRPSCSRSRAVLALAAQVAFAPTPVGTRRRFPAVVSTADCAAAGTSSGRTPSARSRGTRPGVTGASIHRPGIVDAKGRANLRSRYGDVQRAMADVDAAVFGDIMARRFASVATGQDSTLYRRVGSGWVI